MKIRVPDYFERFKCIADKCRDSCCIGWEIDIDDVSREKYASLDAEIGREIVDKTRHGYFPLTENGRCAFLDCRGLCRIISSVGEGYLCDICREHPRYYGVGMEGIDGGIGLGCEEAARIILSLKSVPKIITIERDVHYSDEDEFSNMSDALRETLYNGIFDIDITELIGKYIAYAHAADQAAFDASTKGESVKIAKPIYIPATKAEVETMLSGTLTILSKCETLTEDWCGLIEKSREISIDEILENKAMLRALIYYFTHRYVREGVEDMSLGARVLFAVSSSLATVALSMVLGTDEPEVRSAVLFSKSIEYSTDNVDYILDELTCFL